MKLLRTFPNFLPASVAVAVQVIVTRFGLCDMYTTSLSLIMIGLLIGCGVCDLKVSHYKQLLIKINAAFNDEPKGE